MQIHRTEHPLRCPDVKDKTLGETLTVCITMLCRVKSFHYNYVQNSYKFQALNFTNGLIFVKTNMVKGSGLLYIHH